MDLDISERVELHNVLVELNDFKQALIFEASEL